MAGPIRGTQRRPVGPAGETTGTGAALSHGGADRATLAALETALADAARLTTTAGARRPRLPPRRTRHPARSSRRPVGLSLRQARDDWLRRLEASQKSESAIVAYRVAIDDLLDWSEANGRSVLEEATIVDYLRCLPAARAARAGHLLPPLRAPAPVPPLGQPTRRRPRPIPRPRAAAEAAAGARLADPRGVPTSARRRRPPRAEPARPRRARPARAARSRHHRATPLRALRARLARPRARRTRALAARPLRQGRQAAAPAPTGGPCQELRKLRDARQPEPTDPVFCGLAGGRLQETILADIIRRAAKRAGIEKHVTAHTLRHTAATWLRQELGDTRLVAEYLGHADLSTVARYAHVDRDELFRRRVGSSSSPFLGKNREAHPTWGRRQGTAQSDQVSASGEASTEPDRPSSRRRRRHGRRRR